MTVLDERAGTTLAEAGVETIGDLPKAESDPGRQLRVLHVVSYYPPDRLGGVGEVVAHVHRELQLRGHDSHVLTTGRSHQDPRVTRITRTPGRFGMATVAHSRLLGSFDIVHAHHGEALPLLVAAKISEGPKLLLTLHVDNRKIAHSNRPFVNQGVRHGGNRPDVIQRAIRARAKHALDRAALRLADQVSFISQSAATDVLGTQGPHPNVIYNGLPTRGALPDSVSSVPHAEILYVGAPGPRKRTALLPAILQRVRITNPLARLRIVGFDAASQPTLAADFGRRGLRAAVIFEGEMASPEIGPFYRSSDVLLVPSAYEGLPMVILEAFQRGLAVVATRTGGHAEIVSHGSSGLIAPVDDVAAMAAAIVRLLDDKESAQRMGQAGQEIVARDFTVQHQVDAYVDLYAEMLAGPR